MSNFAESDFQIPPPRRIAPTERRRADDPLLPASYAAHASSEIGHDPEDPDPHGARPLHAAGWLGLAAIIVVLAYVIAQMLPK